MKYTSKILSYTLGLLLLALLASCGGDKNRTQPSPTPISIDESGLVSLLKNPGQETLVVNFWATWCAACRGEMNILHEVARDRPEARFALVSLDFVGTRESKLLPYLEGHDVRLPVYHLDRADSLDILERQVPGFVGAIPVTLVISPGGAVATRLHGRVHRQELEDAIASAAR